MTAFGESSRRLAVNMQAGAYGWSWPKAGSLGQKKAPTPSSQGDFDCRGRLSGECFSTGGKHSLCVRIRADYEVGHIRSLNLTLGQT